MYFTLEVNEQLANAMRAAPEGAENKAMAFSDYNNLLTELSKEK